MGMAIGWLLNGKLSTREATRENYFVLRARVANAEQAGRKCERDRVPSLVSVATGRRPRDLPPKETLYLKNKYGLVRSIRVLRFATFRVASK